MRVVRPLVSRGPAALTLALKVGTRIDPSDVSDVDLVISGGGDTIAGNVALARLLGVPNVFCGSLRRRLRSSISSRWSVTLLRGEGRTIRATSGR